MSHPRQHNRLVYLRDIGTSHVGRTVTAAGLTGTLAGVIPIGDTYQLALIVGSSRVWTAALPADSHIEIHQKGQPT